ncbi:transposase [Methylobacterium sp. WSM2598]|uniref:transposase n=1 Tax=Methylobacterium sp. WSM2598 TaxID=398261 RepID=UPI0003822889|nr:transposase [Methylobacterium sp. WSM2598]
MRCSRHPDEEIVFLLREAENGVPVRAICAPAHVSLATFHRWKRRFGGLPLPVAARLRRAEQEKAALRAEVRRLRRAAALPPQGRAPGPAPAPSHRESGALVGRFASVRVLQ